MKSFVTPSLAVEKSNDRTTSVEVKMITNK